jgi:1,4-dihydroxy-6-naphthoate synthase
MTLLHGIGQHSLKTTVEQQVIDVAYTPDSDDVFNFFAWEQGHIRLAGFNPRFHRHHISFLNHAAAAQLFDVINISSIMYPGLADRYWILATGSSVGRGYGPMLVSRRFCKVEELRGRRIAVADVSTTGGVLATMYVPDAEFIAKPYDEIADAVLAGEFDAGVMIHEELVHFPEKGLELVANLGELWLNETGLPLPVGLNIATRRFGREAASGIQRACHDSVQWALDHTEEAMRCASTFGRGCADEFVPMFSNDDTLRMPNDVRRGLRVLFDRVHDLGLAPKIETIEVIDD